MRKQKATVWCDRAQHEDQRVLAQQRAAKMRANMEVVGGVNATARSAGSSTTGLAGGVRSKIRHHGAPKASAYSAGGNMSGTGVPMRLSASEVDQGDSDEEIRGDPNGRYHQRNGSERSSFGSGKRVSSYVGQGGGMYTTNNQGRFSNGSTPPSAASYSPPEGPLTSISSNPQNLPSPSSDDPGETPVPDMYANHGDYFQQEGSTGQGGSGSSEERGFGSVGEMPQRQQVPVEERKKTSEELRRRGSVDERTTTMTGTRLFVANPDLSD